MSLKVSFRVVDKVSFRVVVIDVALSCANQTAALGRASNILVAGCVKAAVNLGEGDGEGGYEFCYFHRCHI